MEAMLVITTFKKKVFSCKAITLKYFLIINALHVIKDNLKIKKRIKKKVLPSY